MSESYEPGPEGLGGPMPRPAGDGLPPGAGSGLHIPGADDSVDTGMEGEGGDIGQDVGGMPGEG